MTRPPAGASFAQFFPSAARAVQDRATERERARGTSSPSPLTNGMSSQPALPSNTSKNRRAHEQNGASSSEQPASITQPSTSDSESQPGDLGHGIGSASSHMSSASSVFSGGPAQSNKMQASAQLSRAQSYTPLTNHESPIHPTMSAASSKPASTAHVSDAYDDGPAVARRPDESVNGLSSRTTHSAFASGAPLTGRKCIYDPFLDKSLPGPQRRKAQPRFKDFGLVRTPHSELAHTYTHIYIYISIPSPLAVRPDVGSVI